MDPVALYKGDDKKLIASIDAPGWLADGWSAEKPESSAVVEEVIEAMAESLPEMVEETETEASMPVEAEVKSSVKRK
jgi:hypothetical protein